MTTLTIGSRRSKLAQIQSNYVRALLEQTWPDVTVDIILVDTQGDRDRSTPLPAIGGKGLFTAELEEMLRSGAIDLAVHSLKDLPVEDSPGLTVVAVPERAPTEDMLISTVADTVDALPSGAVVGTSSLRRASQLLARRPDLKIIDIRGNVETRLRKVEDPELSYDATVLARAGLTRMGHTDLPQAHQLSHDEMLPAPGQGALGIQGRVDDERVNTYLAALEHAPTRAAVTAERAFLNGLGGGCSIPVAALGLVDGDQLSLRGLVATPDGTEVIQVNISGSMTEAETLGQTLAQQAISEGASDLLSRRGDF